MYSFDLSRLTGYDFYLYGMFQYDQNIYNFYYVITRAANFNIETLPHGELEIAAREFSKLMYQYLMEGQKDIAQWVDRLNAKAARKQETPEIDLEQVDIKDLFRRIVEE